MLSVPVLAVVHLTPNCANTVCSVALFLGSSSATEWVDVTPS